MRRAARALLYLGTAAVVLGLGRIHAQFIGYYTFSDSSRFAWSIAYVGLLCVAAYGAGLPELAGNRRSAVGAAVASSGAAAVGISFAQLLTGSTQLPRFVVLGAPLLLVPGYILCAALATAARDRSGERDRVVLVAAPADALTLEEELARDPEQPATVALALTVEEAKSDGSRDRPVVEAVVRTAATVVVLDRAAQNEESIVAQAAALHEAGIRVRTLTLFYDEWLGKLPIAELERISLLFDIGEIHRLRYARIKRLADVTVALPGLVAVAVILPFVALANLVGNRGPLFYRQPRVGRDGCIFQILKFRTMRADTTKVDWTQPGDPRITLFGGWLRRTHLDELPQVLNIASGDLSFIGPRPEQPQYVEKLVQKLPFYDLRHRVRPGLSGWAQVKYDYGSDEVDALQKLQYEFYYLRHQGLALDLRIAGRTLRSVIGRGGR